MRKFVFTPAVIVFFILISECKKDPDAPTLTTQAISEITYTSAKSGGNISDDGGADIISKGVCWGTATGPSIEGNFTSDGQGSDSFESSITGLTEGTTYYLRAYATNKAGTSYGEEFTFNTLSTNVATLSTKEIIDISMVAALSGGIITNDGGAQITERGICWSTTENPTIENSHTSDGSGTGDFSSNLSDLAEGTVYYVRAYAMNNKGIAYGNQVTFTTTAALTATVVTKAVTEITYTTAVSGGEVQNDGGSPITARGICWGVSENPTIENNHTSDGAETGEFISNLSDLTEGTVYFVRAYATNNKGTAYGNQVTFTTRATLVATVITKNVTGITSSTAVSGGDIPTDGGSQVTARGICWSTTSNPTLSNNHTNEGGGTESFTSNMTGLAEGTTYYVRAYVMNSKGTAYGNEISFTTTTAKIPVLTTRTISEITFTSARSGGDISDDGGAPVTAKGICWNTSEDPTVNNSLTSEGTGSESFTSLLPGLSAATTYYVRAYATNRIGTAYGNQQTFTTTAAVLPVLTTSPVSEITYTTAKSGGEVTSDGGSPVTIKGICWSTSENPTLSDNHTSNGTGTGAFISNMTDLSNGTTYYVRAYATNSVGTAYGNEITFPTVAIGMAQLSTASLSEVTETMAVSGGNIVNNGGSEVTERGVCWSTSPNPTTADPSTSDGSGSGVFTSSITRLSGGTVYHVRAYATNGAGTSYGEDIEFITPVTDVEGNVYKTVLIGTQTWMAENLRVTRFNDNTPILEIVDTTTWKAQITDQTPGYCWYDNNASNGATYGALYNWYVVGRGNVCPGGWHVATENEYQALELYLGIPADSVNLWGWRGTGVSPHLKSSTWDGDNTSGFNALPSGYRAWVNGKFSGLGELAYFWTGSDDAINHKPQLGWYRRTDTSISWIYKATTEKSGGKSIRCIKD